MFLTIYIISYGISFALFFYAFFMLATFIFGAPYVPTNNASVKTMVSLANIHPGIKIADLGSGNGKIVIAFAQKGAIAHGYEINLFLVLWSRYLIRRAGLEKQAHIHWGSFWNANLSSFDVITVYGMSHIMKKLKEKLERELSSHSHVISNTFSIPSWHPQQKKGSVYLYKVPGNKRKS